MNSMLCFQELEPVVLEFVNLGLEITVFFLQEKSHRRKCLFSLSCSQQIANASDVQIAIIQVKLSSFLSRIWSFVNLSEVFEDLCFGNVKLRHSWCVLYSLVDHRQREFVIAISAIKVGKILIAIQESGWSCSIYMIGVKNKWVNKRKEERMCV